MTLNGAAIEAHDLTKTYGKEVRALDGLSFAVAAGTVFGLLGPNGAGKSTTVKILTTLARPDAGTATRRRASTCCASPRPGAPGHRRASSQRSGRRPGGHRPREPALQGQLYGLRGTALAARVGELLERFGLAEAADRVARRLLRRHAAPARRRPGPGAPAAGAVPGRADDRPRPRGPRPPCGPRSRRLAGNEGLTILLTTHYLEEADRLADRLAIVDHGRSSSRARPTSSRASCAATPSRSSWASPRPTARPRPRSTGCPGVRRSPSTAARCSARADDGAAAVPAVLAGARGRRRSGSPSVTVARPSLDDVYLRYAGRSLRRPTDATGRARWNERDDPMNESLTTAFTDHAPPAQPGPPALVDRRSPWSSRSSGCCCSAHCSRASSRSPASRPTPTSTSSPPASSS